MLTGRLELSAEQRSAVEHDGGPLIVLAGPGTGKTRVITHRVAHLVTERGFEPETIVASTFTIKAAGQMREKLADLLGPDGASRVRVGTLHALGSTIVRRFADRIGLPRETSFIDPAQRRRLVKDSVRELGLFPWARAQGLDAVAALAEVAISTLAERGVYPEKALKAAAQERAACAPGDTAAEARAEEFEHLARLLDRVCARSWEQGLLSMHDLVLLPCMLLSRDSHAAAIARSGIRAVVVDEFQDCSPGQIELLALLTGAPSCAACDVCAVGDDDQAIYGFRGSDIRAFEAFERRWRDARVLTLTINRRSTRTIVETSGSLIRRAGKRFRPDKALRCHDERAECSPVRLVDITSELEDGPAVCAVLKTLRAERLTRGEACDWGEFAVLTRTHADADRIAGALELENVPFARVREPKPLDEPCVQDVLAFARWLVEPDGSWWARRLLTRPPVSVPVSEALAWSLEHARLRNRASLGGGDEEAEPFPALVRRVGADRPGVAWLLERYDALAGRIGSLAACDAIEEIVRVLDPVHAGLPDERERAARVKAIVSLLRVARDKQRVLEEPRDLRSFLAYLDELAEADPGFRTLAQERVDADPGEEDEDRADRRAAVQLLTAHAAKGLEFETVIVTRVCPPHGFPKTKGDDRWQPPACLGGLCEAELDAAQLDEERRLFYVACTRAKQRLVIVGRAPKGKSTARAHFYQELVSAAKDLGLDREDGGAVVTRAAEAGLLLAAADSGLGPTGGGLRTRTEDLKRAIRERAGSALSACESADESGLKSSITELERAARQMVVLSKAGKGENPPAWAHANDAAVLRVAEEARRMREDEVARSFSPPSPPLSLSYTQIRAFLDCPRCWYLRHRLRLPDAPTRERLVGQAAHAALEDFYRAWAEADADGRPTPGVEELVRLGRESLRRALRVSTSRRQIDEELDQIGAQLRLMFEKLHDPTVQVLEQERRIEFTFPCDGAAHTLEARLDRIDQMPDGSLRVVDYKTGKPSKRYLEPETKDLQLGLYALALRQAFPDADFDRASAEYWVLATGQRGVLRFADLDEEAVREAIGGCVRGVLGGEYTVGPGCDGACSLLDGVHGLAGKTKGGR
ncbi:MAG TPA: ATP-dependent DNA helicase [Phycisphaerales bacterium]|nr:ATP-dependent DNA helicase [Phycisphaerales bacterium]